MAELEEGQTVSFGPQLTHMDFRVTCEYSLGQTDLPPVINVVREAADDRASRVVVVVVVVAFPRENCLSSRLVKFHAASQLHAASRRHTHEITHCDPVCLQQLGQRTDCDFWTFHCSCVHVP